jgi:hypothetical protein
MTLTIRSLTLYFIIAASSAVHFSCTLAKVKPFTCTDLPEYLSQNKIVQQGYATVPTPFGPIPSVYFGYDRNGDLKPGRSSEKGTGIDIIEYKMLKKDSTWRWQPYMVFSDDNFDGIADRLFLDSDLDGSLDKIYYIASRHLIMGRIKFNKFKPWQENLNPLKPPKFDAI